MYRVLFEIYHQQQQQFISAQIGPPG